jgi:hypothetical protein
VTHSSSFGITLFIQNYVSTELTHLSDHGTPLAPVTCLCQASGPAEEASLKLLRRTLASSALLFLAASTGPSAQQQQHPEEAQEQEILCKTLPMAVRTAFSNAFPKATVRGCAKEVEKDKIAYEISSREGGTGRDVLFYDDGTVIVVEETIAFGKLPNPVQKVVSSRYRRKDIKLSEKVTRDGNVLYEFHVKHRGKLDQIVFDPSGNEVKQ